MESPSRDPIFALPNNNERSSLLFPDVGYEIRTRYWGSIIANLRAYTFPIVAHTAAAERTLYTLRGKEPKILISLSSERTLEASESGGAGCFLISRRNPLLRYGGKNLHLPESSTPTNKALDQDVRQLRVVEDPFLSYNGV
jgi:hypothetical protein